MRLTKKACFGMGLVAAIVALALVSAIPVLAAKEKDVIVANTPAEPVPVTGNVEVTGETTVSGTIDAAQSGTWTVAIDPSNNAVSLAPGESFFYDTGFDGMNDGVTVNLGPFDLSNVSKLRILARAVNGDVTYQVWAALTGGNAVVPGILLDEFTLGGEAGNRYGSVVYDLPPPSVIVRLTESGPGGANYHVVLIGR
jgi:hypothetical protein